MERLVLLEEDVDRIESICSKLAGDLGASLIFIVDRNGRLLAYTTLIDDNHYDLTSLASLASGNIASSRGVARLIGENAFHDTVYEGDRVNMYVSMVDNENALVIIFDKTISLGLVRVKTKRTKEILKDTFKEINRKNSDGRAETPLDDITDEDIDKLFS